MLVKYGGKQRRKVSSCLEYDDEYEQDEYEPRNDVRGHYVR